MKNCTSNIDYDLKSAFFENAHSPFVILSREMNFIDVNNAAVKALGINRKNFIGKNLLDIFPYLEGSARFDSYKRVIETGVPIAFDELTFNGENFELKFTIRAFKIGDCLGVSTLDITNLVNTVDKLKIAQSSLKDINQNLKRKNQELQDFSYVVAHDLKSPLTNLNGLLQMVLQADTASNEVVSLVDKMQIVTGVMCNKIRALNEVIALKSNFSDHKEEIDFSEILKEIKSIHTHEIIKGRTIIKEDFSSCDKINYNTVQLQSILQNLLSNALKYRNPNRKLCIKISTKEIDGRVHLFFKDNGLGFNQNLAGKIFNLFKRMHTHVEGMGIGLYIIQSIIIENGGEIDVLSQVNKGTEFKIKL